MAIVAPTKNVALLETALPKGRRALVSTMEIANAVAPKHLGMVEAQEVAYDTYAGFLMAAGNETTVPADQISWTEKQPLNSVVQIVGQLVNRAGNTFTLASTAIPTDPDDIDKGRPKEARFFVAKGQRFVAVDSTGVRNIGVVTQVSEDGKTITAEYRDTDSDWTIGTNKIDLHWLGYNLDHCECPPCIGYRPYAPTYENSMYKDGVCAEYCEETMIAEGGWEAFPERTINGTTFTTDQLLNDKQRELTMRMDNILMWEKRTPKVLADTKGEPQGTKGIMQQIESKATKIEGTIDSIEDLMKIGVYLKKNGVMMAYLDATPEQFGKLMAIQKDNTHITWNPFENNQSNLIYLGYKGVKLYNGVTILFREWSGLSGNGSENFAKKYNFMITPAGKVEVTLNGKKQTMGYVNLVWFGTANDPFKYKRSSNENDYNCGKIEIKYVNKFAPIVLSAHKFILGVNV